MGFINNIVISDFAYVIYRKRMTIVYIKKMVMFVWRSDKVHPLIVVRMGILEGELSSTFKSVPHTQSNIC